MNPAEACIRKQTVSWLAVLLLLVGGWIAFQNLGRYEDPEFVIRNAVIITPYAGATAEAVAEEVTDPIEAAIQQLQEVKKITSISRPGESEVQVEMHMRFAKTQGELQQIWDKLRRKVGDAQRSLPGGAGPSIVNDDFGDVYGILFGLSGEGWSLTELNDYAKDLRKELLLVEGVAKVSLHAAPNEAIFVEVSASRAAAIGIPLPQVYEMLRQQNLISPAGSLALGGARIRISPPDPAPDLDALRDLRVGTGPGGRIIRLGDIADISRGLREPPRTLMRVDGREAIGIGISNISGGNIVTLGERVRARLAELEKDRPIGMNLSVISDQGANVSQSVDDFIANLLAAIGIVVAVLLVFMGLRSGIIIGFVLLLIVCGTLIAMLLDGIDMHRVSLGALIIALGMLVDNAIVVTDALRMRIGAGEEPVKAAREVVASTIWPLLGGTAVGILAFSAIGFSPTGMGEYAGSLFWVIGYSLFLSWVLAITITPLLCVRLFRPSKKKKSGGAYDNAFYRGYARVLRGLLAHRLPALVVLIGMLVAAVIGFGFVPPGFMPDSSRPQFVIDYWLPQGTDIAETSTQLAEAESVVRAREGVTAITSFIGAGGPRFMLTYSSEPANSAYGQLLVDVDDFRRIPELVSSLQDDLSARFPQAQIKAWKFMLGKPLPSKIEAVFRGPDPRVLRRLAEEAKALIASDPDAVAIKDDWRESVPVLRPLINETAARRAGLSRSDIHAAMQTYFGGRSIGVFRDGDTLLPIIARAPAEEAATLDQLDTLLVQSSTGGRPVALSQFVNGFETVFEDTLIRRQNRFPSIKVQCDPPAGKPAPLLLARLRPLVEDIELPPGYSLFWDGEYEASRESNEGLALTAPYGFAAMILAVVVMFSAVRQALVIWLAAPLAIIGVAIGLLLFQAPFEFMAILGFLSLIGMLVKNAIVLVDQIDVERRAGKELGEAIIESSVSRLMPVAMGAITTILGVAPLLADPFFRSMTVVIMFGLGFATVLTLLIVPIFYSLFFRDKKAGISSGPCGDR
jgi:multidrug efflux pump subunit AcrB